MINQYNKIIEEIVFQFTKRFYKEYFWEEATKEDYRLMDYQGINIWPIDINDRFFSLNNILMCEKYKIPIQILIDFYDEELEAHYRNETLWVDFYNYWRKKENLEKYKKEEKEELEQSEKKTEKAKNIFLEYLKTNK